MVQFSGGRPATDLVILEKEVTLKKFMDMIVGATPVSQDDPINLDDIATAVSAAGLPESVLKRFENFIRLAGIEDTEQRNAENHYFYFGRIQTIKASNAPSAIFENERQGLFSGLRREFILPLP